MSLPNLVVEVVKENSLQVDPVRPASPVTNAVSNQDHSRSAESLIVPPEGGWGWVVCLASFWTNACLLGIVNSFGILFVEMLEEYDDGQPDLAFRTSWVGSLQIATLFMMSPVASILVDRIGIRQTGVLGAVLATSGMIASSFVKDLRLLYVTYGVMLGVGSSIIYGPSLIILGHYFRMRLGMVNGLVACGSAFMTVILPILLKVTLKAIGLFHTMRILGGMLSILVFSSLTWIPIYKDQSKNLRPAHKPGDSANCCASLWYKFYDTMNLDIWKVKGYRIWAIALPIAFLGYFVPFVHLVKHTTLILPDANANLLITCLGITTGVSRLIIGKVADLPSVNRIRLQQIAFITLGIMTACIPFATNFPALMVIASLIGLSDGMFICLMGPIAYDLLGPTGASHGLGCVLGIASFPIFAGPPLAGVVYDCTNSYDIAFYVAGAPPIIAAIILFFIPKSKTASIQPLSRQTSVNPVGHYEHFTFDFADDPKVLLRIKIHHGSDRIVAESLSKLPAAANHSLHSLYNKSNENLNRPTDLRGFLRPDNAELTPEVQSTTVKPSEHNL